MSSILSPVHSNIRKLFSFNFPKLLTKSKVLNHNFVDNVNMIDVANRSKNLLKENICPTPSQIYFDYQSTTPIDARVYKAMDPYFKMNYGNPHSRTHSFGWSAECANEEGLKKVAELINCDKKDLIITSGATESNNLALKGFVNYLKRNSKKNEKIHLITSQIEHKSILDCMRNFKEDPFVEVSYLPVSKSGVIDLDILKKSIKKNTKLISIMHINSEIGTIQPIEEIGKICLENNIKFHTDAAQSFGKIPIDVKKMNIDMLSISGHKIYGPKGIGALFVRRNPRIKIAPLISGGGQQRGLRSGTIPTPLVVGLGKAAEIAKKQMFTDYKKIQRQALKFVQILRNELKDCIKNGDMDKTFPGCINLSFPFVEGESLLMKLNEYALSSGSACTSESLEPSYVLRAIGTDDDLAHCSIRFGFGRFTSDKDVERLAYDVIRFVKELRELSPLYEMAKQGIDLKAIEWAK